MQCYTIFNVTFRSTVYHYSDQVKFQCLVVNFQPRSQVQLTRRPSCHVYTNSQRVTDWERSLHKRLRDWSWHRIKSCATNSISFDCSFWCHNWM